MRLQLLRLHSADQYYFSGTVFFSNFNKNIKLVVVPFIQKLSRLQAPNCSQPVYTRDKLVVKPFFPRISWEQSILWGKALRSLLKLVVCQPLIGNSLKKRVVWFKIFKWVVLNYSKYRITNLAESIQISAKNSKDHKLSDWHDMITSKMLMTKKPCFPVKLPDKLEKPKPLP